MLVAPPLAKLSLAFSSPEYFALMAFGLAMVVLLAGDSLVKALLAMLVGLWIAGIGTDLFSATSRFTFGRAELLGGIEFTIVAIGVFAIGEVLVTVESKRGGQLLARAARIAEPAADAPGPEGFALRVRERIDRRLSRRRAARRRARRSHRCCPTASRNRCRSDPRRSAPAFPKAWPRRRARTTRRPAARWCRC